VCWSDSTLHGPEFRLGQTKKTYPTKQKKKKKRKKEMKKEKFQTKKPPTEFIWRMELH